MNANKKQVLADVVPFKELAEIRKDELAENANRIVFGSVHSHNSVYSSSCINVCKTPGFLIERGFSDSVCYHGQHFMRTMMPNISMDYNTNMHGQALEELKKLPDVIANPLMIIRENDYSGEYNPVTFIYANHDMTDSNGNPLFLKAVVQPNDFYDSVLAPKDAAKVITYFTMRDTQVSRLMQDISEGKCEVLSFDKAIYDELASYAKENGIEKSNGFESTLNVFKKYNESFIIDSFENTAMLVKAENSVKRQTERFRKIAGPELQNFLDNTYSQNCQYGPVVYASDILRDKSATMKEYMSAVIIMNKAAALVGNEKLTEMVMSKTHDMVSQNMLSKDDKTINKEVAEFYASVVLALEDKFNEFKTCHSEEEIYDIGSEMYDIVDEMVPEFEVFGHRTRFDIMISDKKMELFSAIDSEQDARIAEISLEFENIFEEDFGIDPE